jgi:hypothetical protein
MAACEALFAVPLWFLRSERTRSTERISPRSATFPLKSRHYYIAIMLSRIFPASCIMPIICASWNADGPIICD